MGLTRRFLCLLFLYHGFLAAGWSRSFTVLVLNAEHLFDVDGVSVFPEFSAERYGPEFLLTKLRNLTEVVGATGVPGGPEIILFQEFEADQTPSGGSPDPLSVLEAYAAVSLEEMLREPLDEAVRNLPVEVFVLKAFADAGLGPYAVSVGAHQDDPTGRTIAHTNVTFSRLPILGSRTHPTAGARGILEVVVKVGDAPLHVFNNHWKSGAGDPGMEAIRMGNARVLRSRLDQILEIDPLADILVGGDFNSQYDQQLRYPAMARTALNDELGSQGDEAALRDPDGPDLYNLWYELEVDARGSDIYRNEWGTLMHLIVSRGLYARGGVSYVDNSFSVLRLPGRNADPVTGVPIRWQPIGSDGYGYFDHLPILARFAFPERPEPTWIDLEDPGTEEETAGVRVAVPIDRVVALPADRIIQDPILLGRSFRLSAEVESLHPLMVRRGGEKLPIWIPDPDLRLDVLARWKESASVDFVATVSTYRGSWQLVIEAPDWIR